MSNYRRARVPGGSYFFTLVAHDRRPILTSENVRAALRAALQAVRDEHPFLVEAWVLLPDHLHCLWRLPEGDADYSFRCRDKSFS
jgi:putative transposase